MTKISSLFHASNLKVPLLVVQGADDPRVLQHESDEIVAAVRDNWARWSNVTYDVMSPRQKTVAPNQVEI